MHDEPVKPRLHAGEQSVRWPVLTLFDSRLGSRRLSPRMHAAFYSATRATYRKIISLNSFAMHTITRRLLYTQRTRDEFDAARIVRQNAEFPTRDCVRVAKMHINAKRARFPLTSQRNEYRWNLMVTPCPKIRGIHRTTRFRSKSLFKYCFFVVLKFATRRNAVWTGGRWSDTARMQQPPPNGQRFQKRFFVIYGTPFVR